MSQIKPLDPRRWTFSEPTDAGKDLPYPPGHDPKASVDTMSTGNVRHPANDKAILEKRSWDVAMSPGKSIFMNLFMIWMMGSGSGIFSILMVGYAVLQAFTTLLRVNEGKYSFFQLNPCIVVFKLFEGKINVLGQKGLYILISLAVLGYLCNHAANMGLFPIKSGDWVASFPPNSIPERSRRVDEN